MSEAAKLRDHTLCVEAMKKANLGSKKSPLSEEHKLKLSNSQKKKISDNDIKLIIAELNKKELLQKDIAKKYGVSDTTISEIKHGVKRIDRILKREKGK